MCVTIGWNTELWGTTTRASSGDEIEIPETGEKDRKLSIHFPLLRKIWAKAGSSVPIVGSSREYYGLCALKILFVCYFIKSGTFGFMAARWSIANSLKFLECITAAHSFSVDFTLRKGFNDLPAVFFVWVKSKGEGAWLDVKNYNLGWT